MNPASGSMSPFVGQRRRDWQTQTPEFVTKNLFTDKQRLPNSGSGTAMQQSPERRVDYSLQRQSVGFWALVLQVQSPHPTP